MRPPSATRIDHLVVAAPDLAGGAAWCEALLGLPPGPGGRHTLMGTHNRLLPLAGPAHPQAYLEIIAIDPEAAGPAPDAAGRPRRRWFDLDDRALQQTMREQGPRLIHWVCAVPDLDAAVRAWAALGIDGGEPLEAERATPQGLLRWRISVRPDGRRLFGGLLPTLIEWRGPHPVAAMAPAPLQLRTLSLRHPEADRLAEALAAIDAPDVAVSPGPVALRAAIEAPRGCVTLAGGD